MKAVDVIKVFRTKFIDIHKDGSGGAVFSSASSPLQVYASVFEKCDSTSGGAIFKKNSALYVSKCEFSLVRCTREVNNDGGNVIESRECVFLMDKTNAANCWIDSHTGDSPFLCLSCSKASLITINCSSCIEGMFGSTITEILFTDEGSLSYSNSFNSTNYRLSLTARDNGNKAGCISFCNFIQNTVCCLFDYPNSQKISNCCIFRNTKTNSVSGIIYENCYGDFSYSGVTQVSETSHQLDIFFLNIENVYCTCRRSISSNEIYSLQSMIILCSL
jgi:hypothetical protein